MSMIAHNVYASNLYLSHYVTYFYGELFYTRRISLKIVKSFTKWEMFITKMLYRRFFKH